MATVIHANDGRSAYVDVLKKIQLFGYTRPSRNGDTRELGHTMIVLDDPHQALPRGVGRNVSEKIAALEAIQLIGAFTDPDWLVERAPQLSPYREPSGVFWGAYGRRIYGQIAAVVRKLQADPNTRQAVATLWDPNFDNDPGKLDYPCTVALGCNLRGTFAGRQILDFNVTMRSNDAWLGLPYDMFQFTQLHQTIARVLDVLPGRYTHTAWSMHLYHKDLKTAHDIMLWEEDHAFDPTGIGETGMSYPEIGHRARVIALYPDKIDWELTPSERWYRDIIHGAAS
jgi:thymidylate synthase